MGQIYTLDVVTQEPSNSIRAHTHPILETGNLSFPDGRYDIDFERINDSSCTITHRITNAPLIQRLVLEGKAAYVCIVSCPESSYRETHTSLVRTQKIEWHNDDLAEAPMFTPMVVCIKPKSVKLSSKRDGLDRIWHDELVKLKAGARLASGSVVYLQSSMEQLLELRFDPSLGDGQMRVDIGDEPFRFIVNLCGKVHRFLGQGKNIHYKSIMNHIVTACLACLQRDYPEEEDANWESNRSLKNLSDFLEQKNLPRWNESNRFRPEEVATALYPIQIPSLTELEEYE